MTCPFGHAQPKTRVRVNTLRARFLIQLPLQISSQVRERYEVSEHLSLMPNYGCARAFMASESPAIQKAGAKEKMT